MTSTSKEGKVKSFMEESEVIKSISKDFEVIKPNTKEGLISHVQESSKEKKHEQKQSRFEESISKEVTIIGPYGFRISAHTMRLVVSFIYSEKIDLTLNNINSVFVAAEYLNIDQLKLTSMEFLRLDRMELPGSVCIELLLLLI